MSRFARLAALAALPAALLALAAQAQNPPAAAPAASPWFAHMLDRMDANHDGRISQDEFLAAAAARFKRIDTRNTGHVDSAALAHSPLAAARATHRAQRMVMRLDKAGNGYITRDEVVAAAQARFARLDRDGNGKLTPQELTGSRGRHARPASGDDARVQARAQRQQQRFDELDANHDGVVSKDEFIAAASARFQQFDSQGSGKVTAAQIVASPQAQQRAERAAMRVLKHLDANRDGAVSQDEYAAVAQKRFARLDRNGDGFIDAGELPARRWARADKAPPAGD